MISFYHLQLIVDTLSCLSRWVQTLASMKVSSAPTPDDKLILLLLQ